MPRVKKHSVAVAALPLFAALCLVCVSARATDAPMTMETFLDKLMMAESGGRLNARNPRSTAIGPFQFIASTWLQIANKSFTEETKDLQPNEILELRLDPKFARRAAKIYSEQNAAYLSANGATATFANLRLAFLVGPGGAVKLLLAKPETPVASLLGVTVINANPFMRSMSASDLIARAARDIAAEGVLISDAEASPDAGGKLNTVVAATPSSGTKVAVAEPEKPKKRARPRIEVDCDMSRPSCKRWLFLAERRMSRKFRTARR